MELQVSSNNARIEEALYRALSCAHLHTCRAVRFRTAMHCCRCTGASSIAS